MTDWVTGDALGLAIPAHGAALRDGGAPFLTEAFRAIGALAADNSVARITELEECPGGSTGRKQLLGVDYARAEPGLPTQLFVKYSRDFDDPIRDRGKDQLEAEVKLALLSRTPGFPIAVAACLFADYHHESGTGLLITERVAFGAGGIEPHHPKCLDHYVPDQIGHYRALVRAIARLAGAHRAGRLGQDIDATFPFDADTAAAADRIRYSATQLQNRVARYKAFAEAYPRILPANIRAPAFIARLNDEAPRLLEHEAAIKHLLQSDPDMIALCHWNANIDNAWFWHDADGEIECGLLDWGRVGQMNVAFALWGCLSGAEKELWDAHFPELLDLFVGEYQASGGPPIAADEVSFHLDLHVAMMGLAWLMDAPPLIVANMPELDQATSPTDPRFEASEMARTQLHMVTNFLNLWQKHDFGAALDRFLARDAAAAGGTVRSTS